MDQYILLNVKVQAIYYQTEEDELGISYATSNKRIKTKIKCRIRQKRGNIKWKTLL